MRFTLSEDQQEIKRTARDLLASRSTWERVRTHAEAGRYDDALWRELSELGWPGIAVGEEHGGQGLGIVELAVLLEELGYACAAVPFLGSVCAALAVEHAGSDAQRGEWLPRLASGEARGALGVLRDGGAGFAELVPDAAGADVVVLVDHAAGTAALVADAASVVEPVAAIDPTRRYGRVPAGGGEPLEGDVPAAMHRALVAVSAELVGVAQRALDMTVEYVKERKQFGVPVGSFQAVQHKAAQMLLDAEGGRSATYYAAWAADADPAQLPGAASIAKAWTSDAGRSATAAAIQLHGGIGFTWEADVHWLFKRAQLDAAHLGGGGAHRARVAGLAAREREGEEVAA
ncbi:MAG TPA: acyl-CoA dehydrogenase family protein [Solirubrobacteraceae bacterium]|jgi:alkylation response protein AidB-like acyl-CoA dehydrogenase|nr:acyl-CoA dehydrogenase family protein [Solirubrobacteraceae bacterium]